MNGGGQAGKSGASNKPPEPMCPMCGSELKKSPLGTAALRGVEGMAKQMHSAARKGLGPRPQGGYRPGR